jgi:hypothetical protein
MNPLLADEARSAPGVFNVFFGVNLPLLLALRDYLEYKVSK